MIVRPDKTYEVRSDKPNEDWYNEGNYVVDETTFEGQALAAKIREHAPYMNLVIIDGKLVDIVPLPRPAPEPVDPPVNQELADAYEAIAALYEETEALKARIAVLEGGKV